MQYSIILVSLFQIGCLNRSSKMSVMAPSPIEELRKNYWMVRKLGSGGFGKVYLVRHRTSREDCAAKQQPWHDSSVQSFVRNEVSVLKKLLNAEKKHVLHFINYFEGDKQSIILTEFLEGDELFRRISSSKYTLTQTKCRTFARQILNAIEFIHSRGIIHLDLKPENIVLEKNIQPKSSSPPIANQRKLSSALAANCSNIASIAAESSMNYEKLKIIDFGLARDLRGKNQIPINLCGTTEYISPEVMRCTYASFASDMWSIGVILYMMVTGGLSPFWAGNDLRTQRLIVRGIFANEGFNHRRFKHVPKSAINCISHLLVTKPQTRYTSSDCLKDTWLTSDFLDVLENVDTVALRKYLARKRWQKWFITIKAINRMTQLGILGSSNKAKDNDENNIESMTHESLMKLINESLT